MIKSESNGPQVEKDGIKEILIRFTSKMLIATKGFVSQSINWSSLKKPCLIQLNTQCFGQLGVGD